jgi:hypothetical protein
MAVQFGVTTAPGSYGYIQGCTKRQSEEIGEARDADGDVAAVTEYNETEDIEFEYVLDGTPAPIGTPLTIGSNKFYITSLELVESNTGYKTYKGTGKRYIANSLPTT